MESARHTAKKKIKVKKRRAATLKEKFVHPLKYGILDQKLLWKIVILSILFIFGMTILLNSLLMTPRSKVNRPAPGKEFRDW
jgi:hypothetical protein